VVVGQHVEPAAPNGDFIVARYTRDGRLDRRFSGDGLKTIDFHNGNDVAAAVAIQPNGRIVVAGEAETGASTNVTEFALARLTARGRLDGDFSGNGRVSGTPPETNAGIFDIAFDGNGKIVAVGSAGLPRLGMLARYRRNGALDPTFGDNKDGTQLITDPGSNYSEFAAVALDGSSIWVAGDSDQGTTDYDVLVAYIDANGDPIDTFSSDGIVTTDFGNGNDFEGAYGLEIDSQGRPVVGGEAYDNGTTDEAFLLARYKTDGDLDPTFNPTGPLPGTELESFITGVGAEWLDDIVLDGNKIVGVGIGSESAKSAGADDFAILRVKGNGGLDTTFSPAGVDGITWTDFRGGADKAYGVDLQPSGKIVASGWAHTGDGGDEYDLALARYKP
jgi:uncharacterized delta-60 repeat protein